MIYERREYGCKACGRLLNNFDLVKLEKLCCNFGRN